MLFNKWYSQCQLPPAVEATDKPEDVAAAEEGCAKGFTTCAGSNYSGKQNCCEKGYTCVFQNSNYSQCRPGAAPSNQYSVLLNNAGWSQLEKEHMPMVNSLDDVSDALYLANHEM